MLTAQNASKKTLLINKIKFIRPIAVRKTRVLTKCICFRGLCHNKVPQIECADIRCSVWYQSWFLLRCVTKKSVPSLLPSFWQFSDNLWSSSACRLITLIFALMFTWFSPCVHIYLQIFSFWRTLVILY